MKLQFVFLAREFGLPTLDRRVLDARGIGVFQFTLESFPGSVSPLHIVGRLHLDGSDLSSSHQLTTQLLDADGNEVGYPPEFTIVPRTPDRYDPVKGLMQVFTIDMSELTFQRAGDYEIKILVDGQMLDSISFWVQQRG